jgi:acyl-CoA thioester hydrolase
MHRMELTVHLSDTDVTGQVYYSKPLEWMEWCRVEWFTQNHGPFLEYVEKTGITFFPARVAADYKRPIMFGERIAVEMTAKEAKRASFVFEYTLKRGAEVVLKSEITMVCFDTRTKRLASIPADLLEKIQAMAARN